MRAVAGVVFAAAIGFAVAGAASSIVTFGDFGVSRTGASLSPEATMYGTPLAPELVPWLMTSHRPIGGEGTMLEGGRLIASWEWRSTATDGCREVTQTLGFVEVQARTCVAAMPNGSDINTSIVYRVAGSEIRGATSSERWRGGCLEHLSVSGVEPERPGGQQGFEGTCEDGLLSAWVSGPPGPVSHRVVRTRQPDGPGFIERHSWRLGGEPWNVLASPDYECIWNFAEGRPTDVECTDDGGVSATWTFDWRPTVVVVRGTSRMQVGFVETVHEFGLGAEGEILWQRAVSEHFEAAGEGGRVRANSRDALEEVWQFEYAD